VHRWQVQAVAADGMLARIAHQMVWFTATVVQAAKAICSQLRSVKVLRILRPLGHAFGGDDVGRAWFEDAFVQWQSAISAMRELVRVKHN
jgi:hypothetical protein